MCDRRASLVLLGPRVRSSRAFLTLVSSEDAAAAARVREAALAAVAHKELPDAPNAAIVLYAAAERAEDCLTEFCFEGRTKV